MKIRNIIIIFILQLTVILGLFIYSDTQNADKNQIVYLAINNTLESQDKLQFRINEVEEYMLQQPYNEKGLSPKIDLQVGDELYVKLSKYRGKTAEVEFVNKEYSNDITVPFIKGQVVEIISGNDDEFNFTLTKYKIKYGIEDIELTSEDLLDAVAKVKIDTEGRAKVLEIYNKHKTIYKLYNN